MQTYDIKTISTSALPEKLHQLHDIPQQLYAKGNVGLLDRRPRVGIVGARKFTPYGREVTADIASTLARAGVTVVSGLALGIDSIGHQACVAAGGATIAVLPCGIETIYPANHRALANQILDKNGLIVSEYAGKDLPHNFQFLERNRIIAALSDILIVTEAAERSGSLNTARTALELGVTVMAVPGNITSPYSTGTNLLIQNGATPLMRAEDVLTELGIKLSDTPGYLPENEAEAAILEQLKAGITQSDDLLRACKLDTPVFQTHLTMLEIKGVIEAQSNNWRIR